jgi:Putative MetA-pathway of phenol degradation
VRLTYQAVLPLTFASVVFVSGSAVAQDEHINPDQPDVTNGTHIVSTGLMQVEFGGIYIHNTSDQHTGGTPFTVRVGLTDWIEARIGADGLLTQTIDGVRATGFGNLQVGAKLRLWAKPGGVPVMSVLPTINLPTASTDKGLGSGRADFAIAVLTGTDIGPRSHIDVNYGIASIGSDLGLPRYSQHLLSTSISAAATARWNPYIEVFWFSRTEADQTSETSFDGGAIYELGPRLAIDGGVQAGLSGPSAGFAVFGGLSIVFGPGPDAVHARQRRPRRTTRNAGTS